MQTLILTVCVTPLMLAVCVMQMVIDMDGCEKLIARKNASFVLCRF